MILETDICVFRSPAKVQFDECSGFSKKLATANITWLQIYEAKKEDTVPDVLVTKNTVIAYI